MVINTWSPKWVVRLFVILLIWHTAVISPVLAQDAPGDDAITPQAVEIVGGQPASPGEWPWQARIVINSSTLCGGSLIHPRWIMTAAHCVGNSVSTYAAPSSFQVTLGEHNSSVADGSEQVRNVVQVVVHPSWNSATTANDIALLKLEVPVALNSRVALIPIVTSPTDDQLVQPGDMVTVTGWGTTSSGGQISNVLREVQLPIVSNAQCDAAMPQNITNNMLCAGFVGGGKSSCQGDSGGPVVVPDGNGGWKQAGIVSFGPAVCDQAGGYSVSTRVSGYIDWIQSYINSPTGPNPILNPDFELGRNGDWNESSTNGFDLVTNQSLPVTPRSGSYVAWLGGANNELAIIGQIVSLDEKATQLTLYYQVRSNEAACPSNDIGAVQINGVIQPSSVTLCPLSITSDWTPAVFDVTNFAGRTILLEVGVSTDAAATSSMFVDDMSVTLAPSPVLNITNFAPVSSRTGVPVTMNGSNFLDVTDVLFNGTAASFAVQSDSTLSVTVPAQASTGAITVKTAYSTTNSAQTFTVLQPLIVAKKGNGSGSVTSNIGGINCGGDCNQNYSDSTVVILSEQPAANSIFTGWSGACSGNATTCNVNMSAARTVTATFTLKSFAVTVNKVGNGSITSSPSGINCGLDCTQNYTVDSQVTLTAHPGADSIFSGWSGACSGAATECIIDVNAVKSATATFALKTFTLSVDTIGSGSVSSAPTGITCGADCSEKYTINTSVDLTAVADNDSKFTGWNGACTGTGECSVTMDSAKSVTANFAKKTYALTVNIVGSGTVIKSPAQDTYTHGTVVNLTATAADGFNFSGWSGACTGTEDCSVTMDNAKSVTATFTKVNTPDNDAPFFGSTPPLTATVGAEYTYAISALDPDDGDTLALSAPTRPAWLTLTPTGNGTATLSGTPQAGHIGENAVRLEVQDASHAIAVQEFTIIVATDDTESTGDIQGIVKDEEGNGIAGAEVTLTDSNGEVVAAVLLTEITDSSGSYLFEAVPFGEYSITVHIEGMEPSSPSPVTVQAGKTTTVATIILQPSKDALHLPLLRR